MIDFKKKQKRLDKRISSIQFRDSRVKPNTLAEVLYELFQRNLDTTSVFPNGNKRVQCSGGRQRSVEDAYQLAKHYTPGFTYKQVHEAVQKLKRKNIVRSHFCNTVCKTVHHKCNYTTTRGRYKEVLES